MSYPVVKPPKALDYGPRPGPPLAPYWHMAEGCNVARYLAGNPARGVSVNFTIECDGTILSMVPENHVSGSINPRTIRTTDDDDGFYGASVAREVLGEHWKDPNRWVFGIEIGGRAAAGPNALQVAAMVRLSNDLRARYPSLVGNLGHRDSQNVKGCPGKLIPWDRIGGHGLYEQAGESMAIPIIVGTEKRESQFVVDVKAGTKVYRDTAGTELVTLTKDVSLDYFGNPYGVTDHGFVEVKTARLTGRLLWVMGYVKDADAGPPRRKDLEPEDCSPLREAIDTARAALEGV